MNSHLGLKKLIKNKGMLLLLVGVLVSCENGTPKKQEEIKKEKKSVELDGTYYFASQEKSSSDSSKYNYHFIEFEVNDTNHVKGTFYYKPYGTDGAQGSFKGVIDSSGVLKIERKFLAEGEIFKEKLNLTLRGNEIELGYNDSNGVEATLPQVDELNYSKIFKGYQQQLLKNHLNTTDRSRLMTLSNLKNSMGYTDEDMAKLKFMEAMADLDNDPYEIEYLLYVIDPMLCGSGGCNLYLLKEDGSILQKLTVTSPPIYIDIQEIASIKKGQWRNFYVYSDGMRMVAPLDGKYPSNPSILQEIQKEELQSFPEQYQLIMDYLE
ncbi:hypothetical protein J4050_01380 [Winogradskyella sp. DF17]|uniref:Lipoprotein n=1 Tax=Winogradskyella pelagia TaxID=2819984 RepID=A0ABS3SY32_9FLAO|nr:hypothetical protein [Winogradskyella sp. DF17]MBO3115377.1 hypothetical protein [Winogradskyella sp. DF17]